MATKSLYYRDTGEIVPAGAIIKSKEGIRRRFVEVQRRHIELKDVSSGNRLSDRLYTLICDVENSYPTLSIK